MKNLQLKDVLEVQHILPLIYAQQTVDSFAAKVMQLIPELIDSDATSYTEINPSCNRALGAMDSPEGEAIYLQYKPYFELYMHQHPLVQHFNQDPNGEPKKISDYITLRQWRNTQLYQEFYRHFGVTRQIVVILPADKPALIGIALNRERLDFSERDRSKLNLLRVHLAQAYRNALTYTERLHQLSLFDQAIETLNAGIIELDKQLQIARISELALSSLNLFFPGEDNHRENLPVEITKWLAEQLVIQHEENLIVTHPHPCIFRGANGRLTLRLVPTEQHEQIVVTTEQYISEKSPHELQSIFRITRREGEILYWVAQGKSNPEIAIVLSISPRTVQKHLESIFRKLDVETRVQAAIKAIEALVERGHSCVRNPHHSD